MRTREVSSSVASAAYPLPSGQSCGNTCCCSTLRPPSRPLAFGSHPMLTMSSNSFGPDFSAAAMQADNTSKRRRGQGGRPVSDGDPRLEALAESFGTMARLTLANASEIRSLKAISLTSIALSSEHRVAVLMSAAQQQYSQKTKGQKGHGQGIPEHWAWRALVQGVYEATDDANKAILTEHIKKLQDAKSYKGKVGQCIIKKAFGDGKSRIEVAVAAEWGDIFKIIIQHLEGDPSVEVHEGRAPRANNERVLSDLLAKYEKRDG